MWPNRSVVHSKPRNAVNEGVLAAAACSPVASHLRQESSGLVVSATRHADWSGLSRQATNPVAIQ